MPPLFLAAALVAGLAAPSPVCTQANVQQHLITSGKLTEQAVKFGEKVDLVRCGDVTGDGIDDAVFTVYSGGTAGDTHFGVLRGDDIVVYRRGYKVGVAIRDSRSFETLQPHYRKHDPNCCPSSFRKRRFTWDGVHFKARKAKKLKSAPRRFYKP
jgi:hypothetical protein